MRDITKKYSNGEVTVVWKPVLCIHSANCFLGLPEVFKPSQRPWITPEESTTDNIIAQVKLCPSGALSYFMNAAGETPAQIPVPEPDKRFEEEEEQPVEIEVRPGGPLVIKGKHVIRHKDGTTEYRERNTSFCRCGHSKNKPFCDSSHKTVEFDKE